MRILMRNTVFKTGALAGLFLCLLALGGVFPGITTSVHAMHGFIHADEVGTDEAKLKKFVEDAVDAYYIDFIIKDQCDFSTAPFAGLITIDLETAPVEDIKELVPLFPLEVGLNNRSDDRALLRLYPIASIRCSAVEKKEIGSRVPYIFLLWMMMEGCF